MDIMFFGSWSWYERSWWKECSCVAGSVGGWRIRTSSFPKVHYVMTLSDIIHESNPSLFKWSTISFLCPEMACIHLNSLVKWDYCYTLVTKLSIVANMTKSHFGDIRQSDFDRNFYALLQNLDYFPHILCCWSSSVPSLCQSQRL